MAYVILGLVVIVVIYFATKSFSKSVNKNTLVGLYLAAGVILFVVGTLLALGGRLAFAVPVFVLGLLAVSKFLKERQLFLWRSGALSDQKVDPPESQKSFKKSEALLVLDLQEGATRADVRGAYKTCFLALEGDLEKNKDEITKLRQARDFLLKDK